MVLRRDEAARRARKGVAGTTSSALAVLGTTPEGQGQIWRMAALLVCRIVPATRRARALPCAKSALVTTL